MKLTGISTFAIESMKTVCVEESFKNSITRNFILFFADFFATTMERSLTPRQGKDQFPWRRWCLLFRVQGEESVYFRSFFKVAQLFF